MKNQKFQPKTSREIIEQINAEELTAIIESGSFDIIDVRGPKGIESQGAIPGAINIPSDQMDNALDREHKQFNPIFESDGPFLFCCTGGVMSYAAAIKAQEKGIKNVYNLEGGHSAWLKHQEAAALV